MIEFEGRRGGLESWNPPKVQDRSPPLVLCSSWDPRPMQTVEVQLGFIVFLVERSQVVPGNFCNSEIACKEENRH